MAKWKLQSYSVFHGGESWFTIHRNHHFLSIIELPEQGRLEMTFVEDADTARDATIGIVSQSTVSSNLDFVGEFVGSFSDGNQIWHYFTHRESARLNRRPDGSLFYYEGWD